MRPWLSICKKRNVNGKMVVMEIDVDYVAKLSRIKLTEDEKKHFSGELGKILDHFKELEKLDVSLVEPMAGGTDLVNVFREDEELWPRHVEALQKAFPDKKGDLLKEPEVFE